MAAACEVIVSILAHYCCRSCDIDVGVFEVTIRLRVVFNACDIVDVWN